MFHSKFCYLYSWLGQCGIDWSFVFVL